MGESIGIKWRGRLDGRHDGAGGDSDPSGAMAAGDRADIFERIADLRRRLAVAVQPDCDALETELAILSALADGGTQRVA